MLNLTSYDVWGPIQELWSFVCLDRFLSIRSRKNKKGQNKIVINK